MQIWDIVITKKWFVMYLTFKLNCVLYFVWQPYLLGAEWLWTLGVSGILEGLVCSHLEGLKGLVCIYLRGLICSQLEDGVCLGHSRHQVILCFGRVPDNWLGSRAGSFTLHKSCRAHFAEQEVIVQGRDWAKRLPGTS